MTTSNVNDMAGTKRAPGEPLPALACEAHDLKKILTHLADQIADADRRHMAALTLMQERLGSLGSTASGLKAQLPHEMSGVLTRIEDGMAELSERIAEADAQRRAASPPETDTPVEAAPALRSALAAEELDAYARRAQTARKGTEAVDNFDVVDTAGSTREQETWDKEAADALALLYESASADATGAPSLDLPAQAPAPEQHKPLPLLPQPAQAVAASLLPAARSEIAAEVVAMQAKSIENERMWLETRFADVAARLDQSLAGLRGDGAIEAIETRFSTLETKLQEALSSAAKRTDLASLQNIETQVEDLTAQLVSVQTHFSRLDTIELELRALAERMSVDALARILDQKAPKPQDNDTLAGAVASRVIQQMPKIDDALKSIAERISAEKIASLVAEAKPAGPDAGAIAKLVADQVTQRLPKPAAPAVDPASRIDELRATLETYISEQRHGDEQTSTMLDTMQQAMIRLLDRMDAIEQSRLAHHADPVDEPEAYSPRQDQRIDETDYAQRRYDAPAADRYPAAPQPEHASRRPDEHVAAGLEEPLHTPAREPERPNSSAALRSGVTQGAAAADAPDAQPASREDYIAAARRAARMASDMPAEPQETVEEPKKSLFSRAKSKPVEQGEPRQLSKLSMAMLCLILVGASFIAVKSTILAPSAPQPPAAQQPAPAPSTQRSSTDQRIQNLEDADVIIEEERRRSPDTPAPRRSSIQGGADGQPAGASTFPTALTKDAPAAASRQPEMPPASIGPTSLRNAAAKGDASAEFEIGARFAEGRGVTQDLQQAITWYQRAASQGFAPAQYRLGSMYDSGLGMERDAKLAFKWFSLAARAGDDEAARRRETLRQKLQPQEVSAVDAELGSWRPKSADQAANDPRMAGEIWKTRSKQ